MTKVNIFIASLFSGAPTIRLLNSNQAKATNHSEVLYKTLPIDYQIDSFCIVQSIERADFIVIPQSIKKVTEEFLSYLQDVRAQNKTYQRKIIVFISGDLCHRVHLEGEDLIVFKASEYTKNRNENEIIFAPFVEDLGKQHEFAPKEKKGKPIVSFCGYAGFPNTKTRIRFYVKNILLDVWALISGRPWLRLLKRGIYFRQQVMRVLERDMRVETRFIVRSSFSANTKEITSDPIMLRKEYIDSITKADFVLCPKGDGNYSSRFYEVLSLGKIPVLIDTDMVLPFEAIIDYSKFVVRVPALDMNRTAEYILRFWNTHSNDEFRAAQQMARETYRAYLRYDSYFNTALPILKDKGREALV